VKFLKRNSIKIKRLKRRSNNKRLAVTIKISPRIKIKRRRKASLFLKRRRKNPNWPVSSNGLILHPFVNY